MNLKEICKPLEDLYIITGLDWDLSIHHTLTEPTCPTIRIKPEGTNVNRYIIYCGSDNIEESIIKLINYVYTEIIDGKIVVNNHVPYTNSDNDIIVSWLEAREINKDTPFPKEKFYEVINKRFNAK